MKKVGFDSTQNDLRDCHYIQDPDIERHVHVSAFSFKRQTLKSENCWMESHVNAVKLLKKDDENNTGFSLI